MFLQLIMIMFLQTWSIWGNKCVILSLEMRGNCYYIKKIHEKQAQEGSSCMPRPLLAQFALKQN